MKEKNITFITTSRADYSIIYPVLLKFLKKENFNIQLVVAGMDTSSKYGKFNRRIIRDGFKISAKVENFPAKDNQYEISKIIGKGVVKFSKVFKKLKPDLIVVSGDKYEMLSSVIAAVPLNIPIAHIEGGDLTEGAIDDNIRHSITKFSHIHFVSTNEYAKRVIQLGEEPWRVKVTGAPSLDNLKVLKLIKKRELEEKYNLNFNKKILLITFHPVTLHTDKTKFYVSELLNALKKINCFLIFTAPNADFTRKIIIEQIIKFTKFKKNATFIDTLGTLEYLSLLKYVDALVGNSSSGIIEAPSFKLPAVNIGERQEGRIKSINVLNVECKEKAIINAIKSVLKVNFKKKIKNLKNPYGNGKAAEKIFNNIKYFLLKKKKKLIFKKFNDL